jgi:hypothetical protein
MVDDRFLRNSPGSSQRVRYRPMGLRMIEKNKLHGSPAHDMGSARMPTEPLITICAGSTRTQPSRVQEASDKAQSVKRARVISRPDSIEASTAIRSRRRQQHSRNNRFVPSTISIRSNHNVGLSQEVMEFNCQFVRCSPIGRTTAGALFFFITKNNRFTSLNFHKKMETTCRGLLC